MKRKTSGIILAAVGISILIILFGVDSDEKNNYAFHVILADSSIYKNGVFSETFEIQDGVYRFDFVPNGDSPKMLTISLTGPNHNSIEKFELKSESHDAGISQYFTWWYEDDGDSEIIISPTQIVQITINPHGNLDGPFSVFLKKQA